MITKGKGTVGKIIRTYGKREREIEEKINDSVKQKGKVDLKFSWRQMKANLERGFSHLRANIVRGKYESVGSVRCTRGSVGSGSIRANIVSGK